MLFVEMNKSSHTETHQNIFAEGGGGFFIYSSCLKEEKGSNKKY